MKLTKYFVCCILIASLITTFKHSLVFADSKELTLAIGLALPPYNISETNTGMEFDIVKEALKIKGYTMTPKYVPLARVKKEFLNRHVDGGLPFTANSGIDAFYSDVHIVYENVVVNLTKKHFIIEEIQDLKDKSIVAFQDATIYLGEDFAAMAKANPKYKEIPNQEFQINVLYMDRVDTIVIDKNIFYYYRKCNTTVDITQPIVIHEIFAPSPYRVAFVDKKVRDDFNEGLQQLRSSGRYDEIVKEYIGQ